MGKYLEALRKTHTTPQGELPKLTQPPAMPGYVGFVSAPPGEAVDFGGRLDVPGSPEACPLETYLRAMDGPEVLSLSGLPPSPYKVAPWAVWNAQGLHAAAWAAWWAAIARQRAHRPAGRPAA